MCQSSPSALNVLGTPLKPCCFDPLTGYYRDGHCRTDQFDRGTHTVCAQMTSVFLDYSKAAGNDLSTPHPEFGFPGLKPGDRWCMCVARWRQAWLAGFAPPVVLEATHAITLEYVALEILKEMAIG